MSWFAYSVVWFTVSWIAILTSIYAVTRGLHNNSLGAFGCSVAAAAPSQMASAEMFLRLLLGSHSPYFTRLILEYGTVLGLPLMIVSVVASPVRSLSFQLTVFRFLQLLSWALGAVIAIAFALDV